MGQAFLLLARDLGYQASYFNLVCAPCLGTLLSFDANSTSVFYAGLCHQRRLHPAVG